MYTLEEIDRILAKFAKLQNINREPANLYDPLDYMMAIGGKRIRPKLCLLACNLLREDLDKDVIFPAMALEVFHEFTLIHDDIMDRSDTRRGCPTVYKKWNEEIAILSGDAMSILSYKYLACAPKEILPQALDLFSTTALQVCEGQQYDMDFESLPFITMDDYLMMIGLKTAVLLACSAKMGALLGGAGAGTAEPVPGPRRRCMISATSWASPSRSPTTISTRSATKRCSARRSAATSSTTRKPGCSWNASVAPPQRRSWNWTG